MYEELVKRLRYENLTVLQMIDLMDEAADAIEQLIKGQKHLAEQVAKWQAEAVKGDCEAWLSEQDIPHWIPVTERLPKFGVMALCKCRANIYEVLTWTAEGWEHDPQHIYMSGFVTHWMPLPEPPTPKEET